MSNGRIFEVLNVPLVRAEIDKRGLKVTWLSKKLGMGGSAARLMLNDGVLPKDTKVRCRALTELARILDLEPASLVIRVGEQMAAKTA